MKIALPKSNGSSSDAWQGFQRELSDKIAAKDPREFLRWKVVQKTMFVCWADYAINELEFLMTRPLWKERWKNAVRENRMGRPCLYPLYPKSSGNLIHHAYHIAMLEERTAIRADELDIVVEFGGGYGSMCRLFHNLGFRKKYVIFDLPVFSELQRFYLRGIGCNVLDTDSFENEDPGILCISELPLLHRILEGIARKERSLFIAAWSISETPIEFRESILGRLNDIGHLFFAYQERFCEVDNAAYFQKWFSERPNFRWQNWEIDHLPGNHYLIGSRLETNRSEVDNG